jgi:cyclopropane fatty-acyl-phospholipid synthase-like methyltransferase
MDSADNLEFEWDDIYTGEASDLMEPDGLMLEIIAGLEPGRALDVGCGAGGLVVSLAHRGWEVTAVDIAPKAIAAARKALDARGLDAELHVGDSASWKPTAKYDLITNSFALPATSGDQAKFFQMVRDALAPRGTVLIKDFDATMKRHKAFSGFHCPTVDELRTAFTGLEVSRAEVVETPAHHHDGHDGRDGPWTAALLCARAPAQ